jgi:ribosomal protein S12 methylthiotransferase
MVVHLVSLGCARNLVDSETMLGRFHADGWIISPTPGNADVIVVNTCSFIETAADESIDTILALAAYKTTGRCRRLIVAGCLPERYREAIADALPEVDAFIGTGALDRVVEAANAGLPRAACLLPDPDRRRAAVGSAPRMRSTAHTAYLKIAEGCNRRCTYCIIPKLRGRQHSRDMSDVLAEARSLLKSGARELVLIAQDTTAYGLDLRPPSDLASLLDRLADLSCGTAAPSPWVRFLYGHPESITDDVIDVVASRRSVLCPYFDIPIQHASDAVLRRMGRNHGRRHLTALFDKIRAKCPEAALRTTVIVGFPGETQRDVDALVDFVQQVRFDHLGVFMYSDAEDLASHRLANHVDRALALRRHDALMALQRELSTKNNRRYVGKTLPVLIEDAPQPGVCTGRSMFQAPEVDGIVFITAGDPEPGTIVPVSVTDALEYDLIGTAA